MAGMRSIIADLEEKNQESLRKVQDVEKRIAEVETQNHQVLLLLLVVVGDCGCR